MRQRTRAVKDESVGYVSSELKAGKKEIKSNQKEIRTDVEMEGIIERVEVKGGITRNLGNFESGRVDAGISIPYRYIFGDIDGNKERLNAAYNEGSQFLDEMIQEELKVLEGDDND